MAQELINIEQYLQLLMKNNRDKINSKTKEELIAIEEAFNILVDACTSENLYLTQVVFLNIVQEELEPVQQPIQEPVTVQQPVQQPVKEPVKEPVKDEKIDSDLDYDDEVNSILSGQ